MCFWIFQSGFRNLHYSTGVAIEKSTFPQIFRFFKDPKLISIGFKNQKPFSNTSSGKMVGFMK